MMPKQEPSRSKEFSRLEEQYRMLAPNAGRLAAELARQLEHLSRQEDVVLGFPVQTRVKSWSSISEKLERVDLKLDDLTKMQDLVGLRIILLFRRDLSRTCASVERSFRIRKSYDTQERLGADQFGYSSRHFVVDLPDNWLTVPSMSGLEGIGAEIQVRTLAQHIWAEASNALQYKVEQSIPLPIRRAVARTAALLETVDLEFERVLQERDKYRETLTTTADDEPLNVDLIEGILDTLLPRVNKEPGGESYSVLLKELLHVGIRTQGQLAAFVKENLDDALQEDALYVKGGKEELLKKGKTLTARLERGVYFIHTGLVRSMLTHAYTKEINALWESWRKEANK